MTQNKKRLPIAGLFLGIGFIGLITIIALIVAAVFLLSERGENNTNASPTQAGQWNAYLYNDILNEIIKVDEKGQEKRIALQLVDDEFTEGVAVAQRGIDYAAYCSVDPSETGSTAYLNVLDLNTSTQILRTELGSMSFCRVAPHAFSPSGDRVVVALVDSVGPGTASWRLKVVDTDSGAIVNEISSSSPAYTAVGDDPDRFSIMPDVRLFQDDRLIFAVIPWQTEGMNTTDAFDWNLQTDNLSRVPQWGSLFYDFLTSTGEFAWAEYDESLPAGQPGGPMPVNNVIRVSDANGEVRTIFHSGEWMPVNLKFIDGGDALAVLVIQSANMVDMTSGEEGRQVVKWIRIDRDGSVTDLREATGAFSEIMPFRDSHAYLVSTSDVNNRRTAIEYPGGGGHQVLWETSQSSLRVLGFPEIVVNPNTVSPFTAVQ